MRAMRPSERTSLSFRRGFPAAMGSEQDYAIAERVNTVAERLGAKPAQVALAWVAGTPGITAPIIGASKPHHIDDAIAALTLTLDAETRASLEAPYRPKAVTGHL